MTTIAYRDGVMACDSHGVTGHIVQGDIQKIFLVDVGDTGKKVMIGGAGCAADLMAYVTWARCGMNMDEIPDMQEETDVLIVDEAGDVQWYQQTGVPITVMADYFTIGSGCQLALGAMECGATAAEAIEVAMRRDIYTGGRVMTLTMEGNAL